jgi:hypothetical protein
VTLSVSGSAATLLPSSHCGRASAWSGRCTCGKLATVDCRLPTTGHRRMPAAAGDFLASSRRPTKSTSVCSRMGQCTSSTSCSKPYPTRSPRLGVYGPPMQAAMFARAARCLLRPLRRLPSAPDLGLRCARKPPRQLGRWKTCTRRRWRGKPAETRNFMLLLRTYSGGSPYAVRLPRASGVATGRTLGVRTIEGRPAKAPRASAPATRTPA